MMELNCVNNRKNTGKYSTGCILDSTFLNISWVKKEITKELENIFN